MKKATQPNIVSSRALLVAAIMATGGTLSYGQVLNGTFTGSGSGGFSPGWTSAAGDAAVVSSLYGTPPPSGATFEAGLTTINTGGFPTLSGTLAANPSTAVDTALGLATGTINTATANPVQEASGFSQTFSATAGDKISFKWNFLTGENAGGLGKDFAFYTLHPQGTSSSLTVLANPDSGLLTPYNPGGIAFVASSGWQTAAPITIPSSGNWVLGFGVADAGNPGVDSVLGVSSVTYTPVPEPWAWSLMSAFALGGMAVARRVRFNRA